MSTMYPSIRSELSMISARQSPGSCLEGKFAVPLDVGAQTWLLDGLREQVHLTADQFPDPSFQRDKFHQPNPCVPVEFRDDIHVAFGPRVAARDRAEQREAPDARGAQFR